MVWAGVGVGVVVGLLVVVVEVVVWAIFDFVGVVFVGHGRGVERYDCGGVSTWCRVQV